MGIFENWFPHQNEDKETEDVEGTRNTTSSNDEIALKAELKRQYPTADAGLADFENFSEMCRPMGWMRARRVIMNMYQSDMPNNMILAQKVVAAIK